MHTTQEMALESKVLTKAKHMHPEEPSFPKVDIQGPSVPSGEEVLEKDLDETAWHELSLNEQQPEYVEMWSVRP